MARDDAAAEAWLRQVVVGEPKPLPPEGVVLVAPDPSWPAQFQLLAARIRGALGDDALLIEHIGSTAIPGIRAKPIIDVILAVADSADEPAYVPRLEAAEFVLNAREPDWEEHRLLKHSDPACNLHVFSRGCPEIAVHVIFRDWLRSHPLDLAEYERAKIEAARQPWRYMLQYTEAKTEIVETIMARARSAP